MNKAGMMAKIANNNFLFNLGLSSMHNFVYCWLWGLEAFEPLPQNWAATHINNLLLE
jgi:hypothetical protein